MCIRDRNHINSQSLYGIAPRSCLVFNPLSFLKPSTYLSSVDLRLLIESQDAVNSLVSQARLRNLESRMHLLSSPILQEGTLVTPTVRRSSNKLHPSEIQLYRVDKRVGSSYRCSSVLDSSSTSFTRRDITPVSLFEISRLRAGFLETLQGRINRNLLAFYRHNNNSSGLSKFLKCLDKTQSNLISHYTKVLEDNIEDGIDQVIQSPEITSCALEIPSNQWKSVLRAQRVQEAVWGVRQPLKLKEDRKNCQTQEGIKKSSHNRNVHFASEVKVHIILE